MPYRRKPRTQRKNAKARIPERYLKKCSPAKRSLIKFGLIPESIKKPETHKPLTKKLASSSKQDRDEGIASVGFILSNSNCDNELTKNKMCQLWKALFYSFWMSDKTLIQQELARKLANFVKRCASNKISLLYIECFMECIEREWSGIDYLRMNKFLSLIRYFIHSVFDFIALNEWNLVLIQNVSDILRVKINLMKSSNRGFFLHLCDIYIEELIKINRIDSDDHLLPSYRAPISFDALYQLLSPFIVIYVNTNQMWQQQYIVRKIFYSLLESITFDNKQREINLNYPGYNCVDLVSIPSKNNNNKINDDKTHLLFEKKNFDVVVPFKEFERKNDKTKIALWQKQYESVNLQRKTDPLLMMQKMEQFHKVFAYLSKHSETPKKSRKKLNALAKIFIKRNNHKCYDRSAVQKALKVGDKTKLLRKWKLMKKKKKKTTRNDTKQKRKWNKLKIKKNNKLLIKRASKLIV